MLISVGFCGTDLYVPDMSQVHIGGHILRHGVVGRIRTVKHRLADLWVDDESSGAAAKCAAWVWAIDDARHSGRHRRRSVVLP
jgi:hypothetical protein